MPVPAQWGKGKNAVKISIEFDMDESTYKKIIMIYVEIESPDLGTKNDKSSFLIKILYKLLPKANPDFEKDLGIVDRWLLEFDSKSSLPNREIGMCGNVVIMKMPFRENYGYWTDNNLTYQDFITNFISSPITADFFEENWDKL